MNIVVKIEVDGAYGSETLVKSSITRRVIGVPVYVEKLSTEDVEKVADRLWQALAAAKDEAASQIREAREMKARQEALEAAEVDALRDGESNVEALR